MEVLIGLIVVFVLVAFVTLIGHGVWVLCANLFAAIFGKSSKDTRVDFQLTFCHSCGSLKLSPDADCEQCYGSIKSDSRQKKDIVLSAVRKQIDRLHSLGVLDAATRDRIAQAVDRERGHKAASLISEPQVSPTTAEPILAEIADLPSGEQLGDLPGLDAGADEPIEERIEEKDDQKRDEQTPSPTIRVGPDVPPQQPIDKSERIRRLAANLGAPDPDASKVTAESIASRVGTSTLLASFMEEHSIRWGEIVGGLLIICCSIALVISFWSEIAGRPLLKFIIFNSVTAGLFGIGFFVDRRWQLRTTGLGILMISILLVPLNVLAIAAFTDASPPTDVLSIAGEIISLVVFGGLTLLAARRVVPSGALSLMIGVMVPSVMQLLIRRFAHLEASYLSLYLLALAPVACYGVTTGRGVRWLSREDAIDESKSNELFVLFGLITYATLLPLALFLYKIWRAPSVIHDMSPVLSLFSVPAVVVGIFSWRRLGESTPATMRIAGVSIGSLGLLLMALAVFFAWPNPATLLPATLVPGLLFLCCALWWELPAAYYLVSLSALIAWPLVANVLRGAIGWRSNAVELMSSTMSAPTGNLLIPLVGIMGVGAALLARRQRDEDARVVGISTGLVAIVCLTFVTWFGFGQPEDRYGVTWTYAAIAIGAYVGATWINHRGLTWAAALMVLAAVVQGFLFRWPIEGTWFARYATAGLIHASICTVLSSVIAYAKPDSDEVSGATLQAALATSSIASVLVFTAWFTHGEIEVLSFAVWLSVIWFVIAMTLNEPAMFAAFQAAVAVTLLFLTVQLSATQSWYSSGELPWLQAQFLQLWGILLAGFCVVWSALRWVLRPIAVEVDVVAETVDKQVIGLSDIAPEDLPSTPAANWSISGFAHRLQGLVHHEWSCVDHVIAGMVVVIVAWLASYSALPGVAQELALRDGAVGSTLRIVPQISNFEIPTVPSREAAGYGSWVLLAAVIGVVVARSRQWTLGVGKLLLLFLIALACPLLSALCARNVSVASALRWTSAVFFVAASVPLWLRRRVPRWCAEYIVPQTSRRVLGVRETSAAHGLLFAIVLLPYLLMALYVSSVALMRYDLPASVAGALPTLSVVAGLATLVSIGMWKGNRRDAAGNQAGNARSHWMSHAGNAIAFVGIGPILVAVMFAVAAVLMQHPIVGPDPASWFRKVGWSVAYTVPVLLMAVALVGHAIRERSAAFTFGAGVLFQVAATAGFMLALPRMGRGLDEAAWINVAQINTIVAGLVAIAWLAYLTLFDRGQRHLGKSLRPVVPTLLTSYVLISASLLMATLLPALIQLWFDTSLANWGMLVGGMLGWLAFVVVSIAILWWGRATSGQFGTFEVGAGMLAAVILVATTIASNGGAGGWLAFHAVELGSVVALGVVVTGWWDRQPGGFFWFARPSSSDIELEGLFSDESSSSAVLSHDATRSNVDDKLVFTTGTWCWYVTFAIIGVMFALRGAFDDKTGHWWSVGTIALVALSTAFLAWTSRRGVLVFTGGVLWTVGSSVWWLLVQLPKYTTQVAEIPIEFLHFNQLLVIVPIAFSLAFSWCLIQGRGKPVISYHKVATILGSLLFGLTVLVGLFADVFESSIGNSSWLGATAWLVLIIGAIGWYGEWRSPVSVPIVYLLGLLGAAFLQDRLDASGSLFWWTATMLLAAYGLATSYLWSQRAKVHGLLARFDVPTPNSISPPNAAAEWAEKTESRGRLGWLVVANGLLAAIVVVMVSWIDLTLETMALRVPAAHAVLAQAISLALLAKGTSRTPLQYSSLALGVWFAVVFGWSFLQPTMDATVLHHAVAVVVALAGMTVVYGFGLVKFLKRRNDWVTAAERLVPVLVGLGGAALLFVSGCEVWHYFNYGQVPMQWGAIIAVAVALAAVCAACLAAALSPGRDPLGLSETGRQGYVYVAEFVLALLCMHIRLTMPWLFHGWFTRFWPLIAMGIAFLGVGIGELMQRRHQRVLSDPLVTTGALLPVLPVLSFWVQASEVNYALLLLSVAALYAVLATLRKSFHYAVLATVAINGSLWYLLHQIEGLDFVRHPQLWLIPPAMCVLVASHLCRHQLQDKQLTSIRYAASIVIYVASTADIFITGVADAPWLPLVLGGISLAGIFFGIMLRVRAFLYLGVSFLLVSLLTIIWFAAVELEQTWIWWVSGIVTGVLIIALFAVFEKRRDDMLQLVENLKKWES